MVLDKFRLAGNKVMFPIAKKLKWIHPDIVTWATFLISVIIGVLFYFNRQDLLIPIAGLVIFSGFLDYLDGSIAKVTKKASKRGDFLDHTLDRFSDAFIFGGIAISAFVDDLIGFIGVITILLVSYMGTQAHALTGKRNYGGLLGRADRIVLLTIAIVVQFFLIDIPILQWFFYLIILVGIITIVQRFFRAWKDLS